MKFYLQLISLYIFLIVSLTMGGFIIGLFSLRIYFSVLMLGLLLTFHYKFKLKYDILIYALFILFYLFALIINGEIEEVNFLKYFFGRYFICFIAFYGFYQLVKTPETLYKIIYFLIILGVANSLISFLQFRNYGPAMVIPMFLNPTDYMQERLEVLSSFNSGLGVGVAGIFGTIVKNGYLSAVFAALAPLAYEKAKKNTHKIILLLVMFVLIYSVFLTQQRLVFILTVTFYLFYFYKNKKLFYFISGIAVLMLLYISLKDIQINPQDLGRISKMADTKRIKIFTLGIDFVEKHFLFGGQVKFGQLLNANGIDVKSAHNLFLNSFIYSGILGAIFVITLYFRMVKKAIKTTFKRKIINKNPESFVLAGALLIYLLNSLTHNSSLVTGDEVIWILYALFLKSIEFKKPLSIHFIENSKLMT